MRPFISLLASTLLVSSQAAILPIKFNFGSQTPTVFTIAQCGELKYEIFKTLNFSNILKAFHLNST